MEQNQKRLTKEEAAGGGAGVLAALLALGAAYINETPAPPAVVALGPVVVGYVTTWATRLWRHRIRRPPPVRADQFARLQGQVSALSQQLLALLNALEKGVEPPTVHDILSQRIQALEYRPDE